MFYSSHAEELRTFFRDKLGFEGVDVGDGWLIFDLPEADLGVHPTEGPHSSPSGTADISFYCDDIAKTMEELSAKGVEFDGPASNAGFGMIAFMKVPGDFRVMLYQPLYKKVS